MKKKLLSLAVGSALGLSAVTMPAQADSILFPFFIEGDGYFTFLTLRSDGGPVTGAPVDVPALGPDEINYVWNFVDPTAGACTHGDAVGSMTEFDLMYQTVTNPVLTSGGGIDLPASFGDASTPAYLNASSTLGFVIVRDRSREGAFGGQAIIIDAANGLVISADKALNNPLSLGEGNFSSIVTSQVSHDLTWYPEAAVQTFWYVLVTGNGMNDRAGWRGTVDLFHGFGGVWNRDEVFRSGGLTRRVTCFDFVLPDQLLSTDQQFHTAGGGWTWLINSPVAGTGATGVLMSKIETTSALGGPLLWFSRENAFPNLPY